MLAVANKYDLQPLFPLLARGVMKLLHVAPVDAPIHRILNKDAVVWGPVAPPLPPPNGVAAVFKVKLNVERHCDVKVTSYEHANAVLREIERPLMTRD